jgi:hypothetical protein
VTAQAPARTGAREYMLAAVRGLEKLTAAGAAVATPTGSPRSNLTRDPVRHKGWHARGGGVHLEFSVPTAASPALAITVQPVYEQLALAAEEFQARVDHADRDGWPAP